MRDRPGSGAIVGSVLMHSAFIGIIAFGTVTGAKPLPEYRVYKVDLYSPPPQALGEPEAPKKAEPAVIKPETPKTVTATPKPAPTVKAPPKKNVIPGKGKSDVAKGRNPD
ncbi:MAG TPA: hypothetical protein VM100_08715, partial [Longimicrobiales bacterium]|nr:hypothetical protein [Longimicrobiales bacterium]